ncbi:Gfo/Idh/MocA family oxidoreductase, partial [bacterium]|nr:Gfo/Idh/MocA family oxidoreductase [bacterium]
MTSFRVGLIGAGYISRYHLAALHRLPGIRLVGVADLDPARATALAREAKCLTFPTVAELLGAGLDVVHVLTPPASHATLTIQALETGCHVLVEKPLAASVEDCDRIAAAAAASGKTVGVNHSLLFDPFIQRALRALRSGALGDIITVDYFRSSSYPPHPGGPLPPQYRDGGYPFRDLGVHALYLLQEFLGSITDVQARYWDSSRFSGSRGPSGSAAAIETGRAGSFRKADPLLLYDEWRAVVQGDCGTGHIQLSWNVEPLQHQLVLQGTSGTLRVDLFSLFCTDRRSTPLPKAVERAVNALREGLQIGFQTPFNAARFVAKRLRPYHGLQELIAAFYRALADGQAAPVPIAAARPVIEWTERLARPADAAKRQWLAGFPGKLTAPVLLTGGTGFIGGHLLERLLADGQRVRLFVRREPHAALLANPQVEVVLGDLGDPEAVERAVAGTTLVYHVGAGMRGHREDFQRGTVAGTGNLIESILRHDRPKLVYVSSLSVLHAAAVKPGTVIREDWPLEPRADQRGAYTQTKLAAEDLVRAAVRERGLKAVILRPGQVFGPGAPLLTPAVARRVGRRLLILGDG